MWFQVWETARLLFDVQFVGKLFERSKLIFCLKNHAFKISLCKQFLKKSGFFSKKLNCRCWRFCLVWWLGPWKMGSNCYFTDNIVNSDRILNDSTVMCLFKNVSRILLFPPKFCSNRGPYNLVQMTSILKTQKFVKMGPIFVRSAFIHSKNIKISFKHGHFYVKKGNFLKNQNCFFFWKSCFQNFSV